MKVQIKEDLAKLSRVLGKNLYKNEFSFQREVLQNAEDSHRKIGQTLPFELYTTFDEEEIKHYFHVRDFGCSFDTKEDIVKYLCTILESSKTQTKTESNVEVLQETGKYGIGKISTARYINNWEYNIYKNKKGINLKMVENLDETFNYTLSEYFDTEEKDGVEYIVEILDTPIFYKNLMKNVAYFPNVKFNFSPEFAEEARLYKEYYDIYQTPSVEQVVNLNTVINNRFKLIQTEDFQFSSLNTYSCMHLTIDQYAYEINNEIVKDIPNIPIALRFKLSDFEVSTTREDVRLSNEYESIITEKIHKVSNWFRSKFNEQNPKIEYSLYKEWNEATENQNKQRVNLSGISINCISLFKNYGDIDLNIPVLQGIDNKLTLRFNSIINNYGDNKYMFSFIFSKIIRNGILTNKYTLNTLPLNKSNNILYTTVIERQKINYLKSINQPVYFFLNTNSPLPKRFAKDYKNYEYNKEYAALVDKEMGEYEKIYSIFKEDYFTNIDEIVVPEHYLIKEQKQKVTTTRKRVKGSSLVLLQGEITIKKTTPLKVRSQNWNCTFEQDVLDLSELYKQKGLFIYFSEDDRKKLDSLYPILNSNSNLKLILVSDKTKKILDKMNMHNFKSGEQAKDLYPFITKYVTGYIIQEYLNKHVDVVNNVGIVEQYLCKRIAEDIKKLKDFTKKYNIDNSVYGGEEIFLYEIVKLIETNNAYHYPIWNTFLTVKNDIAKLDFIEYYCYTINKNTTGKYKAIQAMQDLCRYRKVKMTWQNYLPFDFEIKEVEPELITQENEH